MLRFRVHARRELVFLALGAMDVCVIAPLLAALLVRVIPVRPLQMTLTLLGAVLAVHYLARTALQSSVHPLLRSGLLGLGMLVSGFLVVHQLFHTQTRLLDPGWLVAVLSGVRQEILSRDVIVFLSVIFLWWRGIVLAQRRLDSESVAFRFRLGVIVLAVTIAVGGAVLSWELYQFVFFYFFVSLMGIALVRAEEVGQRYGGSQSPFGFKWLATLLIASLTVLLLAAGVMALLTGENINRVLAPVWDVLQIVLFGVAYIMGWIAQIIVTVLQTLLREIGLEGIESPLFSFATPEPYDQSQQSSAASEQMPLIRMVGAIFGVLLVLLLVALSLRRLRARTGRQRNEERDSVWEGTHIRHGLRDLLRRGRRRLDEAATALSRSLLGRFLAARTIRRIYAYLCALAEKQGYPRASYETPLEYLPALEQAFPDNREEVVRITEAYVAVHYGEVPERPEDLEIIRAAWERIHETAVANSHSPRRAPDSLADA